MFDEQKYLGLKILVGRAFWPSWSNFYRDPLLRGVLIRVYDLVH